MSAPYGFLAGNEAGLPARLALPVPAHMHSRTTLTTGPSARNKLNRQAPIERHHYRGVPLKDFSRSADPRADDTLICWLLWEVFPSPSPKALAEKAAPVLGLTPRQVENYLGGHSDAKSEHVKKLLKRLRRFERLVQYIEGTSGK